MAEKIVMPKAGMAMETGTIIKWLKEIGDKIAYGEPILEIETDKTTMQVEAMNDGYLLSKLYDAGDEVPVVTTIGYIGEQGEEPPTADVATEEKPIAATEETEIKKSSSATEKMQVGNGRIPATPLAKTLVAEKNIKLTEVPVQDRPIYAKDVLDMPTEVQIKATPLARRIAEINGIDLSTLQGTGFSGKIRKADVMDTKATQDTIAEEGNEQLRPLSGMRKTIAERMLQSHKEIPPVTLDAEANITKLVEMRKEMNHNEERRISFNDLVLMASVKAIKKFPEINVSYTEDGLLFKKDINIGMAVALDEGLIVPVIKNADKYSMSELSVKAKELAAKARDGEMLPDEYSGGTFTVTNLGMFGITAFSPIINLPESCILGVCAIKDRLVMDDEDGIANQKIMGLSLTFDHRSIDGAMGAKFLQYICQLLENPIEMLV